MEKSLLFKEPTTLRTQKIHDKLWSFIVDKSSGLRLKIIFPAQLKFAVFLLNIFGNTKECDEIFQQMSNQPPNTLGKNLFEIMQKNKIKLVPWYKEHDLKHSLLGYRMNTLEEMRMQCFMWGNAGFFCFNTIIAAFFIIWTPEMWGDAPYHFNAGKLVKKLTELKLENCIHTDLVELRNEIEFGNAQQYFKTINEK
jgi:hypothetical protein